MNNDSGRRLWIKRCSLKFLLDIEEVVYRYDGLGYNAVIIDDPIHLPIKRVDLKRSNAELLDSRNEDERSNAEHLDVWNEDELKRSNAELLYSWNQKRKDSRVERYFEKSSRKNPTRTRDIIRIDLGDDE